MQKRKKAWNFNLKMWGNLFTATPQPFRTTYFRNFFRVGSYFSLFIGFLSLIWYLFAPWEGGIFTIIAVLLTGLYSFLVQKLRGQYELFAVITLYLVLNTALSLSFWQTAYFAFYLCFIGISALGLLIFGKLIAFFTLAVHIIQTYLYAVVLGRGLTAPDGQLVKVDALTLFIWWLLILVMLWTVSIIYNDFIKETMRLRHSQEMLTLAQQVGNVGSYTVDLSNDQITWSDQLFRIMGFEPGDREVPLEVNDLNASEQDRELLINTGKKAFEEGQAECEICIINKKGEKRFLLNRISLIRDSSKQPTNLLGTILDITEQKLEEEKTRLRASYAQSQAELSQLLAEVSQDYSQLLNTIVERISQVNRDLCGIQLLSPDGNQLDFVAVYHPDPQVREIMGEVLSVPPPQDDQKSISQQVIKTGKSMVVSAESPDKPINCFKSNRADIETEVRIFSRITLPLRAQNKVIGVLGLARVEYTAQQTAEYLEYIQDLADRAALAILNSRLYNSLQQELDERRRTEIALRDSEERYRAITQYATDLVFLIDPIDLRLIDINPAVTRLLGYSVEESRQLTVYDLEIAERDSIDYIAIDLMTKHQLLIGKRRYRCKNGEIIELEINANLLPYGNREVICAIGRDVSERTRLEEQLRQGQKLQAIGQLAGGVAHDFNNILTVIINFSDLIIEEIQEVNESLVSEVKEIKKAGLRATALTKQLLAFSRQQAMNLEIINLNKVIENLVPMLERLINEDIVLKTSMQEDLGSIKADIGQLEQVVVNLVANARDAMPGGGTVTIETSNLILTENYVSQHPEVQPGSYILLSIADTGMGMDEYVQRHIFEPFFTTKENGKGTGLGLATVHGIIKQLGGHIWVYSEPQQGTTFKIYLPGAEVSNGFADVSPEDIPEGQYSETILLVEDDEMVRKATGYILRKFGYSVVDATSDTALLVYEQGNTPIDLLLTDIVMPGINGMELARILLNRQPDLKILFMSGYSDRQVLNQEIKNENVSFLQKPFTAVSLNQKLRSLLKKHLFE
jgi:PAS domain S-box-containing protein